MKFENLKDILEKKLGVKTLSDIARELDVTPQVVNNWKIRNNVPYKYVKLLRERLNDSDKKRDGRIKEFNDFRLKTPDQQSINEEDIVKDIVDFLKKIYFYAKKEFKILIAAPLLSLFIGLGYYNYVEHEYTTKTKILPMLSSKSGGGARGLAAQFGFDIKSSGSSDLFSAEIYPEILKSRNFMRRLIFLEFKTKKYRSKKELISIILSSGKNDSTGWSQNQIRSSIDQLLKMIQISKTKNSPVISIEISTIEPNLSKSIGDTIISQLKDAFEEHKINQTNERIVFIRSRLKEIKADLISAEEKLKNFREKNRKILDSPNLLLQRDRLLRDVSLHDEIFVSMSSELELEQINQYGIEKSFEILDTPENMGKTYPILLTTLLLFAFFGLASSVLIVAVKNITINDKN